ncbi:MAG: hypothetical protein PHI58_04360 [Candidatus Omnitrophica bacterium]|nr:hypothetical protein [Candidatus Omnitrophota bacterium]
MDIMKKIRFFILICALSIGICGCVTTPEFTPLQRRVIESKELEGTFEDAFKATITVLQDKAFIIKTTDYNGGTLYAESERGKIVPSLGNAKYQMSVNLERFTENRVKIRVSTYRLPLGLFGTEGKAWIGGGLIEDPVFYQNLYAEIQREIFRRMQLNQ